MILEALGIRSHVEQWGGQGENILLLHGWGKAVSLDSHLAPLASALGADYRVTALEFPAHGQSGKPAEPWGVDAFALWVEDILRQLALEQVTIVAHSFGGRVALWLAAERPQLVRRLVLTGAAGLKRPQTAEEAASLARYQRHKRFLSRLENLPLLGGIAGRAARELRDSRSSADYLEADEDMKQSFVRIVSEDLGPLLPRVHQPALLIWGDRDDATPLWMGQRMEKEMKDAALVIFEGRGHFAYLEELGRFALIVRAFVMEDGKPRV